MDDMGKNIALTMELHEDLARQDRDISNEFLVPMTTA